MTDIEELARRAQDTGTVVAVAESLTSGNLAVAIGVAEGASEWFAGGVVAYGTATKHRVLGLREGVDPCSAECAEQLAAGVRELVGPISPCPSRPAAESDAAALTARHPVSSSTMAAGARWARASSTSATSPAALRRTAA
ncbi:CinA family protein [Microbacterium oleivorans]|uniref:CinA family protein n=1 Tax=Microbacterium oleivorans TaxID=273677 RepID=A0A7D5JDZ8_9MICO|nr:CinA family protein [Microbacterium oleivorans]QLD12440.1 CinA family protein [Microbacterium oleivorans]